MIAVVITAEVHRLALAGAAAGKQEAASSQAGTTGPRMRPPTGRPPTCISLHSTSTMSAARPDSAEANTPTRPVVL